eukprot:8520489-Lingulodinium_polyedra.AAC.1
MAGDVPRAGDLAAAGDVARRVFAPLCNKDDLTAGVKRKLEHQKQRVTQRRAEAIGIGQVDATEVSAEELEVARASD